MNSTSNLYPTIAIAGNPNSGKSTLFNRLTGLRQKVANYPGITIEKKTGTMMLDGQSIHIVDLPGTYSLNPLSEEEKIAAGVIMGTYPGQEPISGLLCVIDSSCLERSLGLVLQVMKTNRPTAVLLNMADEMEAQGIKIDAAKLQQILGIPVFSISALKGTGMEAVYDLLKTWVHQKGQLRNDQKGRHSRMSQSGIHTSLTEGLQLDSRVRGNDDFRSSHQKPMNDNPSEFMDADLEQTGLRIQKAKDIAGSVISKVPHLKTFSDKIDRFVMNPVLGPIIFACVVVAVFQSIFTIPEPLMNGIDALFTHLGLGIKRLIPDPLISSFLADGVVAGTGAVIVFLPQILTLFFFIAILEYSGYMARAAMVMDKFMSKLGLQGKSFLPLISSCACAVPGIMASRIIENKRDRIVTIFISPFMPCGARLPVYTLLIGAFVPNIPVVWGVLGLRSLTLLGLYLAGFLAAFVTAWGLKSSVLKSELTPFILEIPPYRRPPIRAILILMWDRSKIFLRRAGTVILLVSMVLWVALSFPKGTGMEPVKESIAGRIGQLMEPVIKPLGFDWKIGVGLLSAQAAREMIIGSLSSIYRIEQAPDSQSHLQDVLRQNLSPLQAISLMFFFVFAMQCFSTLTIAKRELGSWKVPTIMFLYMNALAYGSSLLIYQGGRWLGF